MIIQNKEFLNQFGGSASANLVFVVGFFILSGLKQLCARNSRCHSRLHCCCLEVSMDDRTIHTDISVEEV